MADRISKVSLVASGSVQDYDIEPLMYAGTTGGMSTAYTATLQGFKAVEGASIQLTFHVANGANAALSLSSGEAGETVNSVPIYYNGSNVSAGYIQAGATHTLVYSENGGAKWIVVGTDTNTTYGAGTGLNLIDNVFSVKYGTTAGTAAAGNDSRLSDARTPTAHKHGNIENDGTLGTASRAVVTDATKKITVADLTFADPSASTTETSLSFIDTISQNSQGKISATKKPLPKVSATSDGIVPKGEAVTGAQTQTTKFLRSDGKWVSPAYTTNTDAKVAQIANTDNKEFSILLKSTNNLTAETKSVNFVSTQGKAVTVNPSTGRITAPGGVDGVKWADIDDVPSVSIVGHKHVLEDITNLPNTLSGYGITDAEINAGTIKLGSNTISPVTAVTWDETNKKFTQTINGTAADIVNAASLVSGMGLSNALHFIGITSTTLDEGSTTTELTANSTNSLSKTTGFVDGDVVMDKDQMREYVWSGNTWHLLGITTSAAYTYPQTVANNTWISQVTQGTDGRITATTGSLVTSGEWSGNAVTATTATNLANAPQILEGDTSISGALEAGTNYTLSIGGKTVNFTTPTDENNKVSQSLSSSSKWRKVMLGYKQYDSYDTEIGNTTTTDVIYGANDVAIQPSTGTLRATIVQGDTIQGGKIQLTGDTLSYVGTGATKPLITGLNGNANGHGIKIGGGAVTVIGSGESASSFSPTATSEILYLFSDNQIYLEAGGNTIANRVGFEITSANEIIPVKAEKDTNNYGSIGTNSYKWANIYATTIHGSLDGNADTATDATNATNDSDGNPINETYLKLTGGTMTGDINMETSTSGDTTAADGTIILANSGTKIVQKMRNTSNWGAALTWDNATHLTDTYLPGIGYHNTGHTISIIPYATNTNPWGRTEGLSIGASDLKFENQLVAHAGNITNNKATLSRNSTITIATIAGVDITVTTPKSDNTWRGIQDNLTSSSNTTESLSAKQGYLLANGSARDDTKLPLAGGTMTGDIVFQSTGGSKTTGTSAKISWSGSTDSASIYYTVPSSDKGRLVFNTGDDADCLIGFAYNDSIKAYINNSTPSFYPTTNNTGNIGGTSNKWKEIYATTFNGNLTGDVTGDLSGNAATADKLKTEVSLWGNNFDGSKDIAGNLDWDSDTYKQRIEITDDSTADTEVFTFKQSTDSGAHYSALFTIKDNGNVIIGNRISSTTPSSAVSTNRIAITPYFHTGGPWYIASKDDKTYAYLTLKYGSLEHIEVKSNGKATITSTVGTGASEGGVINLISNAATTTVKSGTYQWGVNHTVPLLASGAHTCLLTGVGNNAYNQAVISYNYVGNGNTGNSVGLGLYSHENYLVVKGTGEVSVTKEIASTSTSTGSFIVAGGVGIGEKLYVAEETHAEKYIVNEKVTLQWNFTDNSLDFVFA